MTEDQRNNAVAATYGLFCLAMLGVYAWACWQGKKAVRDAHELLNDRLLAFTEPAGHAQAADDEM